MKNKINRLLNHVIDEVWYKAEDSLNHQLRYTIIWNKVVNVVNIQVKTNVYNTIWTQKLPKMNSRTNNGL